MTASMIFCGHCGAQNPQNDNFCFSCGYKLSASTAGAIAFPTTTGKLQVYTLLKQRYRVLQTIGQGGMGAVYLAQDTQLGDRLVAVKEMSQQNNQQGQNASEGFKREAHLLASLQHPNLPSIYDHFEESGRWYLVMSFIQGETLEEYLSRAQDQKLPLEEALHIGQELCNVLNYLHTHRPPIIFRDLKPGNIMRSTDGHIYLIDFGIARHFKLGQAKDTANYGSAGYAPPEQYGKAQTTERSDIYSLGATLYELLSGYDPSRSPFRFPSLQSLVPTLPEQLVNLITQMLEMDEGKRPVSIKVVQQELQQASTSVPSAPRKRTPLPSTPKQPIPPPPVPRQPAPRPRLSLPTQDRQIYKQPNAAKASLVPPQPKVKKEMSLAGKKLFSILWIILGVFFALRGIFGPSIFSDNFQADGPFFQRADFGFWLFLAAMTILLARTKESFFPITKARRAEYIIVGIIGGATTLFGIIIGIIGVVTNTPTNSNGAAAILGGILVIMSIVTLWVTHIRIKKTP